MEEDLLEMTALSDKFVPLVPRRKTLKAPETEVLSDSDEDDSSDEEEDDSDVEYVGTTKRPRRKPPTLDLGDDDSDDDSVLEELLEAPKKRRRRKPPEDEDETESESDCGFLPLRYLPTEEDIASDCEAASDNKDGVSQWAAV